MNKRSWPCLSYPRALAIVLLAGLLAAVIPVLSQRVVYAQQNAAVVRVAAGYPEELSADSHSNTLLEVDISGCTFGGTADPDGQYSITASASNGRLTPTFASTLEGGDFPPLLLLEATSEPGDSLIQVTISYCPADAVFILGICSAPGSVNNECKGSMTFTFSEPETEPQPTSYWDSPEHATEEARHHATEDAFSSPSEEPEYLATEEAHHHSTGEPDYLATEEAHHHDEEGSSATLSDQLTQDLADYLAGEGITAPTPGQIGASGIALATLLAGWLLLNQISGVSAQTSLEVIDAWSHGQTPPESQLPPEGGPSSAEPPDQLPESPPESPEDQPEEPSGGQDDEEPGTSLQGPDSVPEEDLLQPTGGESVPADGEQPSEPPKPGPSQPYAEEQALQGIQNVQDLDDAIKQTRQDFETFHNSIPESIRSSEIWQKNVENKFETIKNLLAQGELGQTRTWLDHAAQLLQLRNEIERDLDHLPADSVEAIVWTERTLQALGHFATDSYQTLVTNPAKDAGTAVLPPELAQRWNSAMDELNQDLSNVAQEISQLPREGAQLLTHRNLQQQAQEMIQSSEQGTRDMGQEIKDLYGEREVPVEYPDFIGRGTRKVQELWDHTMNSLFGGN